MKVAVCLSGQPRNAQQTFSLIYENIIKPNNADVFIHMNHDIENLYMDKSHADNGNCQLPHNIDKWVIDNYKPVKYLIEKPRNYKNNIIGMSENRLNNHKKMNHHKNWSDDEHKKYIVKQLYNMYYSIYKCNEIKEIYALENDIHYDFVFRLRFDVTPKDVIQCNNYDPNFIYYLDIGQPDNLISDWLNFGSNAIMNVYSSLFLHIEYLNNFQFLKKNDREENLLEPSETYSGLYEFLLRDHMFYHKIPKKGIRINCGLQY